MSVLLCVLLPCTMLNAQHFKSERLRTAANALGITLADSQRYGLIELTARDGQTIAVRTDSTGTVEHIGIPLFMDGMRVLEPSPVYDFLEYAALNWKYKINPNTLYLSKVMFQKGSWNTLLGERLKDLTCSISNQDDKLYIVSWLRNEQEVAVVGIPIEYELLNNDSRRNIERQFVSGLAAYHLQPGRTFKAEVSEQDLKVYGTEGLFVRQGESYLLEELSQNEYYELKTMYEYADTVIRGEKVTMKLEAVVPTIVNNADHPAETFANLMLAGDSNLPDAELHLDFHLSNYHRQKLTVRVSTLRDYLRQEGCKLYFASSGTIKDKARAVLFVHNASKGYNHLLSLSIPERELTTPQPVVTASVYLYIPPVDTAHLFGKAPTKKSGAKIYH